MYANLAVSMGGRVAEEIIFGYDKVSSSASGDIQYATKLARDMVTRWGMSDKLGPLQYSEGEEEVFLGYSRSPNMHMSNETARAPDTEIPDIVDAGYARAKYVLTENETHTPLLANALLEYEKITGGETTAIGRGSCRERGWQYV